MRIIRDSIIGAVVILVALVMLLTGVPGGSDEGKHGSSGSQPISKTPVLKGEAGPTQFGESRVEDAPSENGNGTDQDPADDGEIAEDRWKARARKEAKRLRRYAELIPPEDRDSYGFIIEKLEWASELGRYRPDNLEGEFVNRLFFAAGRWGGEASFRRAWIYLMRARGADLDKGTEHTLMRIVREMFELGMIEVQAIETDVFGQPLEGGDENYWMEHGFPPLEQSRVAWKRRNAMAETLYYDDFLTRLTLLLPADDVDRLHELLDLFNLRT